MEFYLNVDMPVPVRTISYADPLLLVGSCFTEHISKQLGDLKFQVMQNPHGIVFDPGSVAQSLLSYINGIPYEPSALFCHQELWHSWKHHSQFSHQDPQRALELINGAIREAHGWLKKARWLIISFGTAYQYRLTPLAAIPDGMQVGDGVANCHRAPAQWFSKTLMEIDEIHAMMSSALSQVLTFNPAIRILLTISPVRHLRDGVVENNRSKARLIEATHRLVRDFEQAEYFPAYELLIDGLRDYRFYDMDMVHPNYAATQYVMEKFSGHWIEPSQREIMEEVRHIVAARKHRVLHPCLLYTSDAADE